LTTETTPAFAEQPGLARVAARLHTGADTPAGRWGEVLQADGEAFGRLCAALSRRLGAGARRVLLRALADAAWRSRLRLPPAQRADCAWLAAHSGTLSTAEFALAQIQYGLVARVQGLRLFAGCALSARWSDERGGWQLLRNLDWGRGRLRAAFAAATRHYLWVRPDGRVHAAVIGFPGMLGAVTGVRLDRDGRPVWAVALNAGPWRGWAAGRGEEPTLLLARLLDGPAEDWHSAYSALAAARASGPALVTLVGRTPSEAGVFEFGPGRAPILRQSRAGLLVVTNHFDPSGPLARHNPRPARDDPLTDDLLRSSRPRAAALMAAAEAAGATTREQTGECLLAAHLHTPLHCPRSVHLLAIDMARPWPGLRLWLPGTAATSDRAP
jgi:hypothetical protein